MSSVMPKTPAELKTRRRGAPDLDAVVALDTAIGGRARRAYFERRLAQAQRMPQLHAQFAVEERGALVGCVLGRVLEGEFGRTDRALRLEVINVAAGARGRGAGRALVRALEDEARRRDATELRTAALWTDHAMLRFLDAGGWRLGRNQILEGTLGEVDLGSAREAPVASPDEERAGDPNDYGAPSAGNYEALARDRVELRALHQADLDGVARIDRRLTGHDRSAYLRNTLGEALADAGIRISLAAVVDGGLAGFLMARVDLGDFGRTAPAAVLDTVGVDPLRQGQGIGHALLSQLFVNLGALRVERVETLVALRDQRLFGFLVRAGFRASDRLDFVRPLG
jgi:ribosomal protein S18 acetylase RimI-like enzyme